ncbi:hypothetical protein F8S13_13400 [Chloroflexia bacterium SDU3-3]|nr:hypothetical protein F8S13_13400 [Chloroflexia bacterium SDU3-3]
MPEETYQPLAATAEGAVDTSVAEMRATETITPTALLAPPPALTPEVWIAIPTSLPRSNSARWLDQQADRTTFDQPKPYVASTPVMLFWYDPITGQQLEIGYLIGDFMATAQFGLASRPGVVALEVPYHIDQDYGLTAISPVVKERMRAAGSEDLIQGYVILDAAVAPGQLAPTAEPGALGLPAISALSRRFDVASACERNGFEQSLS